MRGIVRAVHLELVAGLLSKSFIRALRRFVSRRGVLERVISSNVKNFKDGSSRITSLCSQILQRKAKILSKTWNKVAVYRRGPWWEGLVGSVNQKVSWEDFTVLSFPDIVISVTEVEVALKSLPLTNWYQDVEDYPT